MNHFWRWNSHIYHAFIFFASCEELQVTSRLLITFVLNNAYTRSLKQSFTCLLVIIIWILRNHGDIHTNIQVKLEISDGAISQEYCRSCSVNISTMKLGMLQKAMLLNDKNRTGKCVTWRGTGIRWLCHTSSWCLWPPCRTPSVT